MSIKIHPDIASAVSKLQRRSGSLREADIVACRDLLQYLASTIDLGILFGRDPTKGLEGYIDSYTVIQKIVNPPKPIFSSS
jgi:hypothetical protein